MASASQHQSPSPPDPQLDGKEKGLVERLMVTFETPLLDDRSYRSIKLPNQLEVFLVHEPDADKASAAMDVNVGNFSDKKDMPGTAHAVEHLLFLGSKKYPIENAYPKHLAEHSGSSNAWTWNTSTNYYFEIDAKKAEDTIGCKLSPFHEALSLFAQFFIGPLFCQDAIDRELQAVDSEWRYYEQTDFYRIDQVERSLSNPKHPYCYFPVGNLQVLKLEPEMRGVDIRKEFREFHETHYSANRMKCVVSGREPLDTLESWAADLFGGICNKNLQQNIWRDEVPYRPEHLSRQCFIKPVMDSRSLRLLFPFIDEDRLFEYQPSQYISHLIRHEGPGSILAYLKSRDWVATRSLSAEVYPVCPGTPSIFICQIHLTEEGLSSCEEIMEVVFQYISLLANTPPQEWIFEEQKKLADIAFTFKQKTRASQFTSEISSAMQTSLPREWLLSGPRRPRKFDPEQISRGLACLRPDNFTMTVVSQQIPGVWKEKERWYGAEYTNEKIPARLLNKIQGAFSSTSRDRLPELHLPQENQFIPTNLEVTTKEIREPPIKLQLIRNDSSTRLWFKTDDIFLVPKAYVFTTFRSTLPNTTAENYVKARLLVIIVRDALEEYAYNAELAGLDYVVFFDSTGLQINISGYNDKLAILLERVLVTLMGLEIKEDRFEILKERFLIELKNWEHEPPRNQAADLTQLLTAENAYTNEQRLAELPHLTATDVQQFNQQLLRQTHIETFVHGNIDKEDALKLSKLIESTLKPRILAQSLWPIRRSLMFPAGGDYVYHKTSMDPVNNCIGYLLHIGNRANRLLRASTLLLSQMIHETAFNQLRTKQQLGYDVSSSHFLTATTIGFQVFIQGRSKPQFLDERIDSFLSDYAETIANMTKEEFKGHKRSLITKQGEKSKGLGEESKRLWNHIKGGYFDFDQIQRDTTQIEALTRDGIREFYNYYILPASPARSKLAIHIHALVESSEAMPATGVRRATPCVIGDVPEFKSKLQLSDGPQAVKNVREFE